MLGGGGADGGNSFLVLVDNKALDADNGKRTTPPPLETLPTVAAASIALAHKRNLLRVRLPFEGVFHPNFSANREPEKMARILSPFLSTYYFVLLVFFFSFFFFPEWV